MNELAPQYEPKSVEQRLYALWEKKGIFTAKVGSETPKFCIMIPPPNVTGVLHMGHALTFTLEDILVRRKRMLGFNTLWLPGTDHAGIATQMVVERNLMKEQKKSRHDLGRDAFLKEVWKWKEASQGTILSQLRLLGCSVDWSRLRFTLDDDLSASVRECFVRLYREGLIYKGEAVTSWCPRCKTALSDLEVKFKETNGSLWYIRYVLKETPQRGLVVATTRPETLLGDVAVAVHPDDKRYKEFHQKKVVVPLVNREVPVLVEEYVDASFGTGALKITPGHDANDYIIGKRYSLPTILIMDENACLNQQAGPYNGLSRENAREAVIKDLKAQGLLEKEEPYTHNVGQCDRCGTVVEPHLSTQWFVKAEVLAKAAIEAVESKQIRIIPEEWEKTYFEWMRNIRPWCISRQLWWGHRIPVWYCHDCGEVVVVNNVPEKCPKCSGKDLKQEEDVLDTWFSSGLWPISTLGWPRDTPDLKTFYPTDVLETGFDILFFWVARMIMMGIKMTGKIPFHTVYLHPMVRDEYGQKMSKTKGNVKDPLEIIDTSGADSLRFTLAAMAVHGRDVLLSDNRIEGYRNFINKIWNASRFVLMHFGHLEKSKRDLNNDVNLWIWSRLNVVKGEVNVALEQYRFFDAASLLYHFVWNEFCDWYIELIKDEIETRKSDRESTALEVLEESLRLLHPIIPFVTEEIWMRLPLRSKGETISTTPYPQVETNRISKVVEQKMNSVISIVDEIRKKRGENNLNPASSIRVTIVGGDKVLAQLRPFGPKIQTLVRASEVNWGTVLSEKGQKFVVIPLPDLTVYVRREDLIQLDVEIGKVEKEITGMRDELKRAVKKLESDEFTSKAPKDVVLGVQTRKDFLESKLLTLSSYLEELKS